MAITAHITEITNSRVTAAYPGYILSGPQSLKNGSPINSESGGCHDPTRRMMYCPLGGGHLDWYHNMVFAIHIPVNLATTGWTVLSDSSRNLPEFAENGLNGGEWPHPSFPPSVPSATVYSDGKPPARHTYGNVICSPVNNELIIYGGARWSTGNGDKVFWRFLLNPGPNQYKYVQGTPGLGQVNGPVHGAFMAEYEADTNSFWVRDSNAFANYDFATQTWRKHSETLPGPGSGRWTSAYDTLRGLYYTYRWNPNDGFLGNIVVFQTDPDSFDQGFSLITLSGDDITEQRTRRHPGFEYVPAIDRLVLWSTEQEFVLIHPESYECEIITATGYNPGAQAHHGTLGRFALFAPNEIICCNTGGANMFQVVFSDDASPTGTSVDLIPQHSSFTPSVVTTVAEYRYGVDGVETKVFGELQSRVTIPDVPDGTHTAQAGAYDGTGTLIGDLSEQEFTVPFPGTSVGTPEIHSVHTNGNNFVSVTVPPVPNLAMVVFVSGRIADNVVGPVRFDGQDLTEIDFIGAGSPGSVNGRFLAAWYMLSPPVKTGNVTATVSVGATTSLVTSVVFVHNVNLADPFGVSESVGNAGSSSASTIDVPSDDVDLVISAITTGAAGHTPGTGQTALLVNQASAGLLSVRQGISTKPGEETETTMDWTFTSLAGVNTVELGFALKGAGEPDPPNEDDVARIVSTAIDVTVGETDLDIDVTYTEDGTFPFDTEEITLWQVHLLDVNGNVVGTFHENTSQAETVQSRDLPRPDGFGTPYRIRTRERNAETGTIINELFSDPFMVTPDEDTNDLDVVATVTATRIPILNAFDNLSISWTLTEDTFAGTVNTAAYTAIRVEVGAFKSFVVSPQTTSVTVTRIPPGRYPVKVGRYRPDTGEFLQSITQIIRVGNFEVFI